MAAAVLTLGLLLALVAGTWGVLGDGSRRLLARRADDVVVSAFALDQALMKPTRIWFSGHNVYYQPALKGKGKGLVILLHKCGRAASDFWPRSAACTECEGLPMSLAKTKQALLKGYAVAAMSSQDRRAGGGGRCFAWGADASAVVQLVRQLPKQLGLPKGAPVYLDGASSGGSLALRLPLEVEVAGVIGEVIAPGDWGRIMDQVLSRRQMPPALYIHMPLDDGMRYKVEENIAEMKKRSLAVGEIQVMPRAVERQYFSRCSPLISTGLSARLYNELKKGGFLDDKDMIQEDLKNSEWNVFRDFLNKQMRTVVPTIKGQKEYDVRLLSAHIMECLGIAWARHETVGEYMTAALAWLESKGTEDAGELADKLRVQGIADLLVNGR